jgi:hypothetical protein
VLGEYIEAQMMFHAKALELLTVSFQQVQTIDEEGDLQNFRERLKLSSDDNDSEKANRSRRPTLSENSEDEEEEMDNEDM